MSGGKQTTETKSDPWAPAQTHLKDILGQAQSLYKTGGPEIYRGPVLADRSADTMAARGQVRALAGQPSAGAAAQGAIRSLIGNGGAVAGQGPVMGELERIALGGDISANPYFNQVLDRQAGRLADNINQGFSGAGRYGSYAHGQATGDAVGAMRTDALMRQYETDRSRQIGAAGQYLNQGNVNAGNLMQASAMAPGADQASMFGANLLSQLGGEDDARAQALLGNDINIFQQEQMRPYNALAGYAGTAVPIAGLGGTQTQTTTKSSDPLQTALGVGLNVAGMAMGMPPGMFGGGGSMFGSSAPVYGNYMMPSMAMRNPYSGLLGGGV